MPLPEQHSLAAGRRRALMIIRIIGLTLGLLGSISLCYTIGMMIVLQSFEAGIITIWNDTSHFAWTVALLAPAIVLLLASRSLSRWLLPVPRRECHECGYSLRGLASAATHCPECGTDVNLRSHATAADRGQRE